MWGQWQPRPLTASEPVQSDGARLKKSVIEFEETAIHEAGATLGVDGILSVTSIHALTRGGLFQDGAPRHHPLRIRPLVSE